MRGRCRPMDSIRRSAAGREHIRRWSTDRLVRATLGTALHVAPDAGHLVVEEHPDRLAALV